MQNGAKPVRLTLTMLVRDCAKTLRPLLAKLRPHVDEIVIVLGGPSKDHTRQLAMKYADTVIDGGEYFPEDRTRWDFASARNLALPYVHGAFMLWADGDDDIDHPEHFAQIMDTMDRGQIDRLDFPYVYARDEKGNTLTEHQRERIVRVSKEWHWLDRIHETLNTDMPHVGAYDDSVRWIHLRDGKGNEATERNLPILLSMMEEDPKPRTLIHLAHAYFSLGDFERALFYYGDYLSQSGDEMSLWSAGVMGAKSAIELNDFERAQNMAITAAAICPQYEDAYVLLALCSAAEEDDVKAEAWLYSADRAKPAPMGVFRMPLDLKASRWNVEEWLYAKRRLWQKAWETSVEALAAFPESVEWQAKVMKDRECLLSEQSRAAALQLADHLVRHGDVVRAKGLLENFLPSVIRDDPAILTAQDRVHQFLDTEANHDAYVEADGFVKDWDIEAVPRYQWYVERLTAIGAKKVLEVGCHHGLISRRLADLGIACKGIDFNEGMIALANERAPEGATFTTENFYDITEKYDAVLLAEILEHVTPTEQIRMLNHAETLAPVVLGSVPAEPVGLCPGLWEKSDIGAETFRPHIFEFDQNDVETLILTDPERRIVNAHKLADDMRAIPGFGNRVFEFDRQRSPQGLGIAFYLGAGWEHWTPSDIDGKGIGGSETAAVRLAQELSARGHYVTVYGPEDGVYDGVVYRHFKKFDPTVERDVVVWSREPMAERPNAAMVLYWCHDIAYNYGDFTPEIAGRYDRIVLMSEWQRTYWRERYPWLADEKLWVAGNAIIEYPVTSETQRGRFIYSSSPDRGLDDLLVRWPLIREAFPDGEGGSLAELHIFYGWQYFPPQLNAYKRRVMGLLRELKDQGVVWHGRIGQRELAEEFARAQFWLYPSLLPRTDAENGPDFHETYCISALEAQMYGAIPITREVGALAERFEGIEGAFVEPWQTGLLLDAIKAFDEESATAKASRLAIMRENAERATWRGVADRWLTTIAVHLTELQPVEEVTHG